MSGPPAPTKQLGAIPTKRPGAIPTKRPTATLTKQPDVAGTELEAIRAELVLTCDKLEATHDELEATRDELKATRDHVFLLQPRRTDLTESQASELFTGLRFAVERLVRSRLIPTLDALNKGHLDTCRPVPDQAEAFQDLVKEAARNQRDVEGADEYQVVAVVMEFLDREVFKKPFGFVSEEEMGVLTDAFSLLLTLRKDYPYCEDWRNEAFAAFASDFEGKNMQNHIKDVTKKLCLVLSAVFDLPDSAQPTRNMARALARSSLLDSVRDEIVTPAVKLASGLELAASVYSVKWPSGSPQQDLEQYRCLNLATGRALALLQPRPPAHYPQFLFSVAPALVVQRAHWPGGHKTAEAQTLCKATVLVQGGGKVVNRGPRTIMQCLAKARSRHSLMGKTQVVASRLQRFTGGGHRVGSDNGLGAVASWCMSNSPRREPLRSASWGGNMETKTRI